MSGERRGAAMPELRIRAVACRDIDDALLRRLHGLANGLMAEDLEHFGVHAAANDVVHLFEAAGTGELAGFQFWKAAPTGRALAIVGGKLRVLPQFRGGGVHLVSGLRFYLRTKVRRPVARIYRLSMASIFGFVSITEALAEYAFFDPAATDPEGLMLASAFRKMAEEDHFGIDEDGLFAVDIFMTAQTLQGFGDAYFARPAAVAYAARHPAFRTNGCYLGFWFRFTPRNVAALVRAVARKRRRTLRDHRARWPFTRSPLVRRRVRPARLMLRPVEPRRPGMRQTNCGCGTKGCTTPKDR